MFCRIDPFWMVEIKYIWISRHIGVTLTELDFGHPQPGICIYQQETILWTKLWTNLKWSHPSPIHTLHFLRKINTLCLKLHIGILLHNDSLSSCSVRYNLITKRWIGTILTILFLLILITIEIHNVLWRHIYNTKILLKAKACILPYTVYHHSPNIRHCHFHQQNIQS